MTREEAKNILKSYELKFGDLELLEAVHVLNRKTLEPIFCNDEDREQIELAIKELARLDSESHLITILDYIRHVERIADSI